MPRGGYLEQPNPIMEGVREFCHRRRRGVLVGSLSRPSASLAFLLSIQAHCPIVLLIFLLTTLFLGLKIL